MKKFYKICTITALSLFAAGSIIIGSCAVTAKVNNKYITTDSFEKLMDFHNLDSFVSDCFIDNAHDTHIHFGSDHNVYSGDHQNNKAAIGSEVESIQLDIGACECKISRSDDEYFHIKTNAVGKFQYYTSGDTFYVSAFETNKFVNTSNNIIYIDIPDSSYDTISLNAGASSVNVSDISCDTFDMSVGVGDINIKSLQSNELISDVGVGSASIADSTVYDASLDVGMGTMDYSGLIEGDLYANVGMGSMEFDLSDKEKKHNFDFEEGFSGININGNVNMSAFADDRYIDNESDSTYTLSCGMGSININFKK